MSEKTLREMLGGLGTRTRTRRARASTTAWAEDGADADVAAGRARLHGEGRQLGGRPALDDAVGGARPQPGVRLLLLVGRGDAGEGDDDDAEQPAVGGGARAVARRDPQEDVLHERGGALPPLPADRGAARELRHDGAARDVGDADRAAPRRRHRARHPRVGHRDQDGGRLEVGARPVDAILLRGAVLLRRSRDADDAISIKGTAVEPRNWDTFLCAPSPSATASASRASRRAAAAARRRPTPGRRRLRRAAASKAKSRIATEAASGQPSGGGRQYEHGWTDLERGRRTSTRWRPCSSAIRRRCPTSCAR